MESETVGYPKKRARTRAQLRRAAMQVLAKQGPDGATVGEIVKIAGMAQGTFYNHYPSMVELIEEIADQLGTGVEIARDALDAVESDPACRVAIGVFQLIEIAERDPVAASAFVSLAAAKPDFRARVRAIIGRVIVDGIEVDRFRVDNVSAAVNVVLGSCLQSMRSLALGDTDPTATIDVVRLVLRALGVSDTKARPVLKRAQEALAVRAPEEVPAYVANAPFN
jgi:AcrR family transcriptional regulator